VAGLLFLGWLSFLGYLVVQTRSLIVVSRPQLLVSQLAVVGEVSDEGGRAARSVKVSRVLWSQDAKDRELTGVTIDVQDLPDVPPTHGYRGAGEYVLLLVRGVKGSDFAITPLPSMPGFAPAQMIELLSVGDDGDKVAQLAAELRGTDVGAAKGLLKHLPLLLAKNLRWPEAATWRQRFLDAGALVRVADGEIRIYRATDDVLAQVSAAIPE
jgi:hypothetical protein